MSKNSENVTQGHKVVSIFADKEIYAYSGSHYVDLTSFFLAGNAHRLATGKTYFQMAQFLASAYTKEYVKEAAKAWGVPEDKMIVKKGSGAKSKTYVHISVAVLAAERLSTEFHVHVHKEFIEGRLLQFRVEGATEFRTLNRAISDFLPGREEKENKGIFIQTAKLMRERLGVTENWDEATAAQQQRRHDLEKKLVTFLEARLVRDWEHLKELISTQ